MNQAVRELAAQFREAGIAVGDSILVHSSLSSLGAIEGGAETVVDALLWAVAPEGTVLFPTLTGCPDDSAASPPLFDARFTRAWTGQIPEAAREKPRALRSLHPTHSVTAIGKLARWFTEGHELVRTPCGFGSPYDKLASLGGRILLIGVTQVANTSFHHAEEIAGVPFVLQDQPADAILTDSAGRQVLMRSTFLHRWDGPRRDYDALEGSMIEMGICEVRKVGQGEVRIIDAMLQRMFLLRKLLEDPLAVLALAERENWLGQQPTEKPFRSGL